MRHLAHWLVVLARLAVKLIHSRAAKTAHSRQLPLTPARSSQRSTTCDVFEPARRGGRSRTFRVYMTTFTHTLGASARIGMIAEVPGTVAHEPSGFRGGSRDASRTTRKMRTRTWPVTCLVGYGTLNRLGERFCSALLELISELGIFSGAKKQLVASRLRSSASLGGSSNGRVQMYNLLQPAGTFFGDGATSLGVLFMKEEKRVHPQHGFGQKKNVFLSRAFDSLPRERIIVTRAQVGVEVNSLRYFAGFHSQAERRKSGTTKIV